MFSTVQRSPEEAQLHQLLSEKMRKLCVEPTEAFVSYTHHLQVLGINWRSYQIGPKYVGVINSADLKSSDDENKFNEVILKLVNVLDEEWYPTRSTQTKAKFAEIIPTVEWKFNKEVGKAFAVFSDKEKAVAAVGTLENQGIQASVMYSKDSTRTPFVVIANAFFQVKKIQEQSEGLKSGPSQ